MKTFRLFRPLLALATLLSCGAGARADLAAIFTNAAPPVRRAMPVRPSIIFIQCHDLGYGDLSCYGQTNYQTPNLDWLAAQGMRFTDYRVGPDGQFSVNATLLTGKQSAGLAADETTVAQRLLLAGYHTGLFGEWSLAGKPWEEGFEEFGGFLDDGEGRNYFSDYIWRHAPQTVWNTNNNTMETYIGKESIYDNLGGQHGKYLPDLMFMAAANYIQIHKPSRFNQFQPFFLLLNLSAPRTATVGRDDFPVPTDAPFTSEPWPQAAKDRAALITRIDSGVGRVLEKLDKLGMTNNVAIFFSSTGGPESFANTNLMRLIQPNGDRNTPEARLRVPMIVCWPGVVAEKRTNHFAWQAVDFAPTVLEIGRVKMPGNFEGASILSQLTGQSRTNRVKAATP